ncbi:MAG: cell division protein FtsA [Thermonemataceae bacterium]
MSKDKIVVGLDIGSTKICAIVGRKDEYDKIEILGMGKAISDGVKRGVVSNIDKTVHAITQAIQEAEKLSGINIHVVNVGIAGQHIKSLHQRGSITRHSTEDEISAEDVNRLINDMYKIPTPAGNQIIHVMPQDFIVDNESDIKEPVGMSGVKLEADFHIITAQTTAINNIKRCVQKAGLEIENLILEPIASGMSVLREDEKEAGVCLVDIGGGTTDIAIFYENIIRHTAVIPFGGAIITDDIKKGCMVMQNQAELLKIRFGKAISEEANENEIVSIPGLRDRAPKEISVKNLAYIIEARMSEIVEEVHKEIIKSGFHNKLVGGLVISGGGALLQGAEDLFAYMTGLEVRLGLPTEYLSKNKIELVKTPIYATPVGLMLAGFKALDYRDDHHAISDMSPADSLASKGTKKDNQGSDFFRRIIEKTRSLLMDDFNDKQDY